jgi:hypothetical protein
VTAQTRHHLASRMYRLVKTIGVVGIGIAGISAMVLVAAHGQMDRSVPSHSPKPEVVADAAGNLHVTR